MIVKDKKFPTCTCYQCDICKIKYPINNAFLLISISEPNLHICPDCELANGVAKDGYAHIPFMDYVFKQKRIYSKRLFGGHIGYATCGNCKNISHRLGENYCYKCGLTDEEAMDQKKTVENFEKLKSINHTSPAES